MPEERTWMASYNLQEGAQQWYMQVQEDKGTLSWPHFKELLNLHFRPPLRSAPLFELVSCWRIGTVEGYQDRIQALLPHAGHLDEAQCVQLFTGGLLPPLNLQIASKPSFPARAIAMNPQSLAAAMSLARQMELWSSIACPRPRHLTRECSHL
jgi:hypothetical protein